MSSLLEGDVHSGGRQKQGRGGAPVGEVTRGRRALGRFVRRRFQADRTPAKALGSSLECLKKQKEEVTAVCQATVARPWVCATSGDSASPLNAAAKNLPTESTSTMERRQDWEKECCALEQALSLTGCVTMTRSHSLSVTELKWILEWFSDSSPIK